MLVLCFFIVSVLWRCLYYGHFFFFFKQKTAYEMRISDWSSDVCSSDLSIGRFPACHPWPCARPPTGVVSALPSSRTGLAMIHDSILGTIGRTPVVRLNRVAPANVELYAKVEAFNPGG